MLRLFVLLALWAFSLGASAKTQLITITEGLWQPLPSLNAAPGEALMVSLPMNLPAKPRLQRLIFTVKATRPNEPLALLLPSGASAMWVEWNSHLVGQAGAVGRAFSQSYFSGDANQPLRIELPAALWQDGMQRLVVTLSADHLQPIYLPTIYIGTADALDSLYRAARRSQVETPWVLAGALGTLSAILLLTAALARNPQYILAGLTALFATLHLALQWVPNPLDGNSGHVAWAVIYRMMLPLFMFTHLLFWLRALDLRYPRFERFAASNLPFQALMLTGALIANQAQGFVIGSVAANLIAGSVGMGLLLYKLSAKPTAARAALFVFMVALNLLIIYNLAAGGIGSLRAFVAPWLPYAMLTLCLGIARGLPPRALGQQSECGIFCAAAGSQKARACGQL
jgi:hypothetical protein